MSVYSDQCGVAGAARAASETDHLECPRSAFRDGNRETLTPREGVKVQGGVMESCGGNQTLSDTL